LRIDTAKEIIEFNNKSVEISQLELNAKINGEIGKKQKQRCRT
jgi:hypothetical protein